MMRKMILCTRIEHRPLCSKHGQNPCLENIIFSRELLYLQCTRTGPMPGARAAEERPIKVRTGRVYSGTPMSGHWV